VLTLPVFLATLAYSALGIVVFALGFWTWDRLTPEDLWGELCRGNQAVATLAGAVAIGLSIIIAAAIHG